MIWQGRWPRSGCGQHRIKGIAWSSRILFALVVSHVLCRTLMTSLAGVLADHVQHDVT